MGTIGILEDKEAWGAPRGFIHSMLRYFINITGGRGYLAEFLKMFEYSYNAIRLDELDDDQLAEFLQLLRRYRSERGYGVYVETAEDLRLIEDNLSKLEAMVEGYLERRRSRLGAERSLELD